ncbi:hypothetical protein PTTG_02487 [Puccinia triticina 1-1 BBBD Race 1]|uniref:Uncharacterized protein n=1 Tax=Puccinia triticina (isolate 1-1 / race 1 (BBBD)) TaxID=630390 RepID=A0A0C4ENZ0_PUCT1|nr:hypothetical protein PTTG_02487 [Puccinia triticina 1-1 BBBD Race 1]
MSRSRISLARKKKGEFTARSSLADATSRWEALESPRRAAPFRVSVLFDYSHPVDRILRGWAASSDWGVSARSACSRTSWQVRPSSTVGSAGSMRREWD